MREQKEIDGLIFSSHTSKIVCVLCTSETTDLSHSD